MVAKKRKPTAAERTKARNAANAMARQAGEMTPAERQAEMAKAKKWISPDISYCSA